MIVAYNALSVRADVVDGAATYTLNLLRHLPAALPDVQLVVYARARETRIPSAPNLRVRRVPLRGGAAGRVAIELGWLPRELRSIEAAALLSPNESFPPGAPCPVVVIAQNAVYHCGSQEGRFTGATLRDRATTKAQFAYYRRRMGSAYAQAAAVVACSRYVAELLAARAGLDLARTTVVLSGSDSFLLPAANDRDRGRRLLVVSALAPYKKLDRTLELFAALRQSCPGISLEIVGGDWRGFRTIVERDVARLGLAGAVTVTGPVATERLVELYSTSAALLHLSTCESFGLPLVEAMRYGLPVVAADHGVSPEIAGGAAVLVDVDRPAEAAADTAMVLADPDRAAELRALGRARAAELTWARTAQGIAGVVESVIGRAG
jgi:glycosyltransferase involved in cell wall biosynthesis